MLLVRSTLDTILVDFSFVFKGKYIVTFLRLIQSLICSFSVDWILMDIEDKSWMNRLRWTDEYIRGVNNFLDKAFERSSQGNEILCPCKKCVNRYWHSRNVVEDHLVVDGFVNGYTKWVFHGEGFVSRSTQHPINNDEGSNLHDDIDGLL